MLKTFLVATALAALTFVATPAALAQATARPCTPEETPGPACLLASQPITTLPAHVYWQLDRFPDAASAGRARTDQGTVVEAFGATWLFTIADKDWRPNGGDHVTTIGPLPVAPAATYRAEYLRSIFAPGTSAPLHVHSGPEAFFAVSGDTCLETPAGVRTALGPGNSLFVEGGPPMLLMAIGTEPRRGFALILHDSAQPPTTLIHDWMPKGLCGKLLPPAKP